MPLAFGHGRLNATQKPRQDKTKPASHFRATPVLDFSHSRSSLIGHFTTRFFALTAHPGALFHALERFARLGTTSARLSAEAADLSVHLRTVQHEIRACLTHLSAIQHRAQMRGLDMGAAHLQTVLHRIAQAHRVATQARFDALARRGRDFRTHLHSGSRRPQKECPRVAFRENCLSPAPVPYSSLHPEHATNLRDDLMR